MNDSIKPGLELNAAEQLLAGADAVRCFRLITFVSQRLRYLLDQRLREADLTTQQGFLLTIVGARQRPSLGEVAEVMSTTHQNVKQIAIALERKGMLRIVTDESDGRVRRLEATDNAAKQWGDRNAGDFQALDGWFSSLSRDEQKTLSTLLARLSNGIA
jgi:DNA-binding MarR family transcriptional regulator